MCRQILELESALYSRDQTIKELRMRLENHETSEDDSGLHEANNDNDDSLIGPVWFYTPQRFFLFN